MRRMRILLSIFSVACLITIHTLACAPAVVVKQPPPARTEVRPAKPWPNAVWIAGHWKWSGGRYVWVSGRWAKAKRGKTWMAGHWARRARGWVWVKGHWR
jgi:hypothetical protein